MTGAEYITLFLARFYEVFLTDEKENKK